MNVLSTVLLQVGEVYKRLRSQVRGSQSRQRRCLRSELKAVLVPCIFEHTLKLYIIFQLCGDVADQTHRKQVCSHSSQWMDFALRPTLQRLACSGLLFFY